MKISIISTGGTIACKKDDNIHLDSPFKVVDYADENLTRDVDFSFSSPFTVLSENMDFALWQKLIAAVNESESDNIIILHGSDTLAYTSSLLANMFYDKNIVITASDKPIEDKTANGISNFNSALRQVLKNQKGVFVSYNGIFSANEIVSADSSDNFLYLGKANEKIPSPRFAPKNILVIKPYINIDYNNYNIDILSFYDGNIIISDKINYQGITKCITAQPCLKVQRLLQKSVRKKEWLSIL